MSDLLERIKERSRSAAVYQGNADLFAEAADYIVELEEMNKVQEEMIEHMHKQRSVKSERPE